MISWGVYVYYENCWKRYYSMIAEIPAKKYARDLNEKYYFSNIEFEAREMSFLSDEIYSGPPF